MFIDEAWIKTNMAPLRGWGARGKRLRGFTPYGHWRTLTFLGALRCDRIAAPCVFDGPINGQCFRAYVAQQLVPVLEPGDIVVMDNLGSHKSAAIRQMIRASGARLWYLPPYSPDLNPIEQMLRHLADKIDEAGAPGANAESFDALERQISGIASRLDEAAGFAIPLSPAAAAALTQVPRPPADTRAIPLTSPPGLVPVAT